MLVQLNLTDKSTITATIDSKTAIPHFDHDDEHLAGEVAQK
jgi:hypothetical protein